ncbi:hypothetical protein ECC02_004196 [Trypanosoma cruzi]|uniref:Transmembrane protein n=1 Tax=Trypanosoma cruzi TaxID=5693 RepID=A0A7J6Y7H6_TRYCR|nr:hypothetical protein ECC02_004196 [Trypanosoma cruzi]
MLCGLVEECDVFFFFVSACNICGHLSPPCFLGHVKRKVLLRDVFLFFFFLFTASFACGLKLRRGVGAAEQQRRGQLEHNILGTKGVEGSVTEAALKRNSEGMKASVCGMHSVGKRCGVNEDSGRVQDDTTCMVGQELNNGVGQREEESADVQLSLSFSEMRVGTHTEYVDSLMRNATSTLSVFGGGTTLGVSTDTENGAGNKDADYQPLRLQMAWDGGVCMSQVDGVCVMLPAEEAQAEDAHFAAPHANSIDSERCPLGCDENSSATSWMLRQRRLQNRAEQWRRHEEELWRRRYEQSISQNCAATIVKVPQLTETTALQSHNNDVHLGTDESGEFDGDASGCDDSTEPQAKRFSTANGRRLRRYRPEPIKSEDDDVAIPLWQKSTCRRNP